MSIHTIGTVLLLALLCTIAMVRFARGASDIVGGEDSDTEDT